MNEEQLDHMLMRLAAIPSAFVILMVVLELPTNPNLYVMLIIFELMYAFFEVISFPSKGNIEVSIPELLIGSFLFIYVCWAMILFMFKELFRNWSL